MKQHVQLPTSVLRILANTDALLPGGAIGCTHGSLPRKVKRSCHQSHLLPAETGTKEKEKNAWCKRQLGECSEFRLKEATRPCTHPQARAHLGEYWPLSHVSKWERPGMNQGNKCTSLPSRWAPPAPPARASAMPFPAGDPLGPLGTPGDPLDMANNQHQISRHPHALSERDREPANEIAHACIDVGPT